MVQRSSLGPHSAGSKTAEAAGEARLEARCGKPCVCTSPQCQREGVPGLCSVGKGFVYLGAEGNGGGLGRGGDSCCTLFFQQI